MAKTGLDDFLVRHSLDAARRFIVDQLPAPMVPTWPLDALPDAVRRYVEAQARAIGVPPEAVAVPLLVFAGSTIGNAIRLQLKRGWTVLPTLWAGMIGRPGEKKTPAQQAAQWPLTVLQTTLYDAWQASMAEYEADLREWADAPKDERAEKPQVPALDHLFTTDATVEKLVEMLWGGRGVAITRDELSGFIGAMDKYRGGKGDDRQQYLSLWAGTPVKVDRKGGGTLYAPRPVAGVYGGIQPDLTRDLHSATGARDGMVERFLLFRPDVRRTGWTDEEVDPALVDPVTQLFQTLRAIEIPDNEEIITVQLNPAARAAFIDWYNANDEAVELATGLRQGFYAKLDSQLARIALILHCLHHPGEPGVPLSEDTMQAAIAIVEFFRAHFDRVLPLIGDDKRDEPGGLPSRVLGYLRRPELRNPEGWVRRGDLLHRLSNVRAEDLTAALAELQERGLVESRIVSSGTKPAEEWRIVDPSRQKNQNNPNNPDALGDALGDRSDSADSSEGSRDLEHGAASGPGGDVVDSLEIVVTQPVQASLPERNGLGRVKL